MFPLELRMTLFLPSSLPLVETISLFLSEVCTIKIAGDLSELLTALISPLFSNLPAAVNTKRLLAFKVPAFFTPTPFSLAISTILLA